MDYLWSPWRYRYVSTARPDDECVFCHKAKGGDDEEELVVYRGQRNLVMLNLYPYTTGHLMIAPYEHVATLSQAGGETLAEMMELTRIAGERLDSVYRPKGLNIGMNIGECAGAGIAGHIHMHVVPRWPADANFMTTIGETRVLPEDLKTTYEKLRKAWGK
jgi:ATP adenylyltransferase